MKYLSPSCSEQENKGQAAMAIKKIILFITYLLEVTPNCTMQRGKLKQGK
jgi:hypothetical protein